VRVFCLVEESASGRTDLIEVATVGPLVSGIFTVKTSTVPTDGHRRFRPKTTRCRCISDLPISHRLEIPPATNRALYYNRENHAFKTVYQ